MVDFLCATRIYQNEVDPNPGGSGSTTLIFLHFYIYSILIIKITQARRYAENMFMRNFLVIKKVLFTHFSIVKIVFSKDRG